MPGESRGEGEQRGSIKARELGRVRFVARSCEKETRCVTKVENRWEAKSKESSRSNSDPTRIQLGEPLR